MPLPAQDAVPARALAVPVACMALVVLASNILVQYPFQPWGLADYLTWGAFTYPFAFLINDLTNRYFGPARTRRVVYVGFVIAVGLSAWLSTPRIALASGSAFLCAQLLDVEIFNRLRRKAWWLQPSVSSLLSAAVDTCLFFTLAFSCAPLVGRALASVGIGDACAEGLPWTSWALCDYLVKLALAVIFILPYGAIIRWLMPVPVWREPPAGRGGVPAP